MEADGSQLIIAGATVFAVLSAARLYLGCCEAAAEELGESRLRSYEDEDGRKGSLGRLYRDFRGIRAAFAVHRIFNTALTAATMVIMPLLPLINGSGTALRSAVIMLCCSCIGLPIMHFLGYSLPAALMRGERAESFALATQGAVKFLAVTVWPVTAASYGLAALMCPSREEDGAVTEEEILLMVDAGNETGSIESSEREMINNVFEFHELTVSDVMTHRTDIVGVSAEAAVSEVVYTAINSGFSRIPVYRDSIDHIEGIIYVKDLLCLIGTQSSEGVTVSSFLRDAEYVPESCLCGELFKKFTENKQQIAVAVDEYGGTAGLVTMEDLVESIVGSIQDEYDNEAEDITEISDDTYTINGTADPSDVMEKLGYPLPDPVEYDTMSGFVTDLLGRIPEEGENPSVSYKGVTFTVLLTEDMRIVRLKAVISNKEEEKELTEHEDSKP